MDQNLAASHRVGVDRDLVIQELGEAVFVASSVDR